jgi:hypothetical protein
MFVALIRALGRGHRANVIRREANCKAFAKKIVDYGQFGMTKPDLPF